MIISKKEAVSNALGLIKKGASLNWNIDNAVVSIYSYALRTYPNEMILSVCKDLAISWKLRYPPQPAVIRDLCDQLVPIKANTLISPDEREERWQAQKRRYKPEIDDFISRILKHQPLTDKQQKARILIDKYMVITFGHRDCKKELKQRVPGERLSAYAASFIGLYIYSLQGTLKEITGNPQGNLKFSMGGGK